jgi:hypothetical protein
MEQLGMVSVTCEDKSPLNCFWSREISDLRIILFRLLILVYILYRQIKCELNQGAF